MLLVLDLLSLVVFCRNTHRDAPAHTNSAHTHTHTHTHTQTNTRMRAHKCHASHTKFVHTKATNEFTDNTHTHFWMYFAPTHRRLNFHFPLNIINLRISSSSSAQFSPRPVSLYPPRPLPMFLILSSSSFASTFPAPTPLSSSVKARTDENL